MSRKISIAHQLSADAGTEGDVTLYEVEPARRFVIKSVYISFPAETDFELALSIFRGIRQIAPYIGAYRGEAQVIEDEVSEEISSSERVVLHYRNESTATVNKAFVLVRGELEE